MKTKIEQIYDELDIDLKRQIKTAAGGKALKKEEKNKKIQQHIVKKVNEFLALRSTEFDDSSNTTYNWLRDPNNQIYLPFLWNKVAKNDADVPYNLSNLQYAVVSLIKAKKLNLNSLFGANLSSPQAGEKINLEGAQLECADLRKASFSFTNLKSANLKSAKLQHAELTSTKLEDANLEETNFEEADLTYTKLKNAKSIQSNFKNANLSDANIGIDQLLQVNSLYKTPLPHMLAGYIYGRAKHKLSLISILSQPSHSRVDPDIGTLYIGLKIEPTEPDIAPRKNVLVCKVAGRNEAFEITAKDVNNDAKLISRVVTALENSGIEAISNKDKETLFNTVSKLCKGHLKALEDKVVYDYFDGLRRDSKLDINIDTNKCNLDWKFNLIRFSGFSPLQWGAEPGKFEKKLEFLEKNSQQILRYLIDQLNALEKTYEHDRIHDKDHGVFWKRFSKKKTRDAQISGLKSAAEEMSTYVQLLDKTDAQTTKRNSLSEKDSFGKLINALVKVKTEIEAEDNLWESELKRKINGIFADCFDKNKLPTIEKPEGGLQL